MAASGFLISKTNERQNLLRANMMKTNLLVLFADTMSGCPFGVQRMAKTATIAPCLSGNDSSLFVVMEGECLTGC